MTALGAVYGIVYVVSSIIGTSVKVVYPVRGFIPAVRVTEMVYVTLFFFKYQGLFYILIFYILIFPITTHLSKIHS